ncbi:hypothetical protein SF12_03020, partial [Streptomyces sp. MBRL 601]
PPGTRRRSRGPDAFTRLPPGSITAHGWLAGQLGLQLDGLCGRFAETSHFLAMDTLLAGGTYDALADAVPYPEMQGLLAMR